jgi:hypothetical protein
VIIDVVSASTFSNDLQLAIMNHRCMNSEYRVKRWLIVSAVHLILMIGDAE